MTICSVVLCVCCQSVLLVVLVGGLSLVHALSYRSFCCRSEDDMVVMSGDVGCWCALFGILVGVSVLECYVIGVRVFRKSVHHDGHLCMSARVCVYITCDY